MTIAHVYTVAFQGIEAREVDVQVHIARGNPFFAIVGLADKAVGESRDRVKAALSAIGLALPPDRITVNLAPADLPKEGSHYDLPIALAILAAMGVLPVREMAGYVALGELALDAALTPSRACCRQRLPPPKPAAASSVRRKAGPKRRGPAKSKSSPRRRSSRSSITSRVRRCSARRRQKSRTTPAALPISRT